MSILIYYKNKGETPLQALDRLRIEKPDLKNERLSYAGRLDPMAEGLLLVLIGESNNEREKYLGLDKTYQSDILFGVQTDTHDILGKVLNVSNIEEEQKEDLKEKILENLKSFEAEFLQSYPKYSSKTVGGIPLFEHTRGGREVEDIKHIVTCHQIKVLGFRDLNSQDFYNNALSDIDLIKGDFRQEEIKQSYKENLENRNLNFLVLSLEMKVSSGFYIRQFASDLGQKVGIGAIALKINRSQVGDLDAVDYVV